MATSWTTPFRTCERTPGAPGGASYNLPHLAQKGLALAKSKAVVPGLVWGFCCQGRVPLGCFALLAALDRLVGAARISSRLPGRPPCAQADWPASSYTAEHHVPDQDAPCAEPVGGLGGGPNLGGGVFQP